MCFFVSFFFFGYNLLCFGNTWKCISQLRTQKCRHDPIHRGESKPRIGAVETHSLQGWRGEATLSGPHYQHHLGKSPSSPECQFPYIETEKPSMDFPMLPCVGHPRCPEQAPSPPDSSSRWPGPGLVEVCGESGKRKQIWGQFLCHASHWLQAQWHSSGPWPVSRWEPRAGCVTHLSIQPRPPGREHVLAEPGGAPAAPPPRGGVQDLHVRAAHDPVHAEVGRLPGLAGLGAAHACRERVEAAASMLRP